MRLRRSRSICAQGVTARGELRFAFSKLTKWFGELTTSDQSPDVIRRGTQERTFRTMAKLVDIGTMAKFVDIGSIASHVESGEERFLIEWDGDTGGVWYNILAFSRPNHVLTRLGYPVVRRLQKRFGRDSAAAMFRAVNGAVSISEGRQVTG